MGVVLPETYHNSPGTLHFVSIYVIPLPVALTEPPAGPFTTSFAPGTIHT